MKALSRINNIASIWSDANDRTYFYAANNKFSLFYRCDFWNRICPLFVFVQYKKILQDLLRCNLFNVMPNKFKFLFI
jgi:hypothetical protein